MIFMNCSNESIYQTRKAGNDEVLKLLLDIWSSNTCKSFTESIKLCVLTKWNFHFKLRLTPANSLVLIRKQFHYQAPIEVDENFTTNYAHAGVARLWIVDSCHPPTFYSINKKHFRQMILKCRR